MSPSSEPPPSANAGWAGGFKIGIGLAASAFALAVTFGALARGQGWSVWAAVAFSTLAFSGSAQFAALTVLAGGGGVAAAVGSASLMSARFLPMGVAVAASLHGGRFQRALEGQTIVDGSWASAYMGNARFDREKMIAATAVQWPAWILGTLCGALLAPSAQFVHDWGLDVIFPAYFLLLLLSAVRASNSARWVALTGGLIALAVVYVGPTGVALLAASSASLLAILLRRDRTDGPT